MFRARVLALLPSSAVPGRPDMVIVTKRAVIRGGVTDWADMPDVSDVKDVPDIST